MDPRFNAAETLYDPWIIIIIIIRLTIILRSDIHFKITAL